MRSNRVLSAVALAGITLADNTCKSDITITSANQVISCDTIDGNVTIDKGVSGNVQINGPSVIKGDLVAVNGQGILAISSTTLTTIGGQLQLQNLQFLQSLELTELRSVKTVSFEKLAQLETLNFGASGVTKASSITITDTFLDDLSGLNIASVDTFNINNNKRLATYNSDLVNVTSALYINSNGQNMAINMSHLQTAGEIQLSQIKSFEAPKLQTVTGSLAFTLNPELESFTGNMVQSINNSITFDNNAALTNISFPQLTSIGDMTIRNNSKLTELEGFPQLKHVAGGIVIFGVFDKAELPKLNDVQGTVNVSSTSTISGLCDYFQQLDSNGNIKGKDICTENNAKAANGTAGGTSSTGSKGSSGSDDDKSAAGLKTVNMALLGLAAVAGFAQLL